MAAEPSESLRLNIQAAEKARLEKKPEAAKDKAPEKANYKERLWKGWVLPASDADTWFTAGSAAYYQDLQADDLDKAMDVHRATFRAPSLAEPDPIQRFRMAGSKGALVFDALRRKLGDDQFFALMTKFFAENTTKTVSASAFIDAAGVAAKPVFAEWLAASGLPGDAGGATYTAGDVRWMGGPIASGVLVYGTVMGAGANRYAAEQLQKKFLERYEI